MQPRHFLKILVLLFVFGSALGACRPGGATPAPGSRSTAVGRAQSPAAPAATQPGPVTPTSPVTAARAPIATQPGPAASASPATAASAPAATRPAPAASGSPSASAPGQVQATPGSLPVPGAGALAAYTAHLEYSQETVRPSPTVTSSVAAEVQYQGLPAPGAYTLAVSDTSQGGAAKAAPVQMVVAGQDAYIPAPGQGGRWLKVPVEPGSPAAVAGGVLDPNRLAGALPRDAFTQANLVRAHEQVGGEDTAHYRIAGPSLATLLGMPAGSSISAGQGDVWVSYSGGYVKQFTFDVTGPGAGSSQIRERGTLLVTGRDAQARIATPLPGDVIRIDAMQAPQATPAGTPAAVSTPGSQADPLAAIPVPPQGRLTSLAQMPAPVRDALTAYTAPGVQARAYLSSDSPEHVFDFYRREATGLGWREMMRQPGTAAGQPWLLLFNRGSQDLQVIVVQDAAGGGSGVLVQIVE